jgi:TonB-linked SusC/RagA family outer membrane protein
MKRKYIIILLLFSGMLTAQNITVSGTVYDDGGVPLVGATVILQNTSTGTITDFDGNFNFDIPNNATTLVVSYIGFLEQKVNIGDTRNFAVKMKPNNESLDEVVVVGYGSVKKSDLTGSVSTIKAEELSKMGSISLDQALAGRAAGVIVTQGSGVPGSGASIKIRGINSMTGSDPLYVIDGIPLENTSISSISDTDQSGSQISPLSMINPSDIASIEILKDASATAIYGSRGANGVVLVTTKSGKTGKAVVEISTETSIANIPRLIDVQDANQWNLTRYEAFRNAGIDVSYLETRVDSARAGLHSTTKWQDKIFRQSYNTNTNLSISGGNKDLRYLMSSNFLDAKGVVEETDFQRVSTRLNLDANVKEGFKVGTRIIYTSVTSNQQSTTTNWTTANGVNSIIQRALKTPPTIDFEEDLGESGTRLYTPLEALQANDYDNLITQFIGNVYANINVSKNLIFKTNLSYQNRNTTQRYYQLGNVLPEAYDRRGWARTTDSKYISKTLTNTLSYNKKFGKSRIDALLGQSLEWREYEDIRTSNYGFPNDLLTYFSPGTAEFNDPDVVTNFDSKLASFFGRVNYVYNNKFLLTLTGRYDGSSKFAANNKWGLFPAAAVGYKISEEKFLKNVDAISNLKLRLSYGIVGNQALREYQSLSQLAASLVGMGIGGGGEATTPIFFSSQLPNENLKWETTTQYDAGLDIGFFKNKFTATIDYYKKRTEDLLVIGNPIPAQSGFTSYTENVGAMEADGFDIGLTANIINTDKFSWTLDGTLSTGKTKIAEMKGDYIQSGYNQGWVSGGTQRLIIGEEIGTFYGYKTAGIAQFNDFTEFQGLTAQEQTDLYNSDLAATYTFVDGYTGGLPRNTSRNRPGEQLYKDTELDGELNEEDRGVIGRAQQDVSFGINNSFSIGNFDVSFFFDGQIGQDIVNVTNFSLLSFSSEQQLTTVRSAWTPENNSNTYPRLDQSNFGAPAFLFSDRFIEDGSFIRLQNVSLGYNLPRYLLEKLNIMDAKIYVSGSNLFTISDYTGFNPDVSLTGSNNLALGHDDAGYPVARTFRLGVNLKF